MLIPYVISGTTHAFMSPTLNPVEGLTKFKDFFPTYHRTKPIVSIKEPMNLEQHTSTLRVFRSTPPTKNHDDYISWLDKIETKMSGIWKEMGIFDLIQLSRNGLLYFQNMFVSSLYYWESVTNTF